MTAEFLAAITPVFSVTSSFRNHSNMLIWCSRNISYFYECYHCFCCIISWYYYCSNFTDWQIVNISIWHWFILNIICYDKTVFSNSRFMPTSSVLWRKKCQMFLGKRIRKRSSLLAWVTFIQGLKKNIRSLLVISLNSVKCRYGNSPLFPRKWC